MIRLVRVELLKIRTTRLWIGLLLPALGLSALGAILRFALVGTTEGAQAGLTEVRTVQDVRDIVLSGSVVAGFALVIGAVAATSEHRYRTIAATFLATPARGRVVVSKALAAAILGAIVGALGALLPLLVSVVWLLARGDAVPFGSPVTLAVLSVTGEAAYSAAVGAGVGAAVRSQLVAILSLLGWVLVVEPLVGALVPSLVRWMPFTGAGGLFGRSSTVTADVFGPVGGAVLVVTYLLSAVVAGIWVTDRVDVG